MKQTRYNVYASSWKRWFAPLRRYLRKRAGLAAILENMGWLYFDRLSRVGLGLLVGIWVARYLGAERYGQLNYAMAFVALFGALASLGMEDIIVRDIVEDIRSKNEILGTAFALRAVSSLLVVAASTAGIMWLRPDADTVHSMVLILAIATTFRSWYVIDQWFQSQVASKFTVWSKSIAYIAANVFKVGAVLLQAPVVVFAAAVLLEVCLTSAGLVVNYRRNGHVLRNWRVNRQRARSILSDSWPLAIASTMVMIYMRIDLVMLGQMTTDATVGIYSAATRIIDIWEFIPLVIASSLFPSLVKTLRSDRHLYQTRLQQFYDLNAAAAYLLIAVTIPLAPLIIHILYGAGYSGATPIFVTYVWSSLFIFLGVARSRQFVNEGMIRFTLVTSATGVVINIGTNLVLIPQYGGMGAAYATVAAQVGAAYLTSALVFRTSSAMTKQTLALVAPVRYLILGIRYAWEWRSR